MVGSVLAALTVEAPSAEAGLLRGEGCKDCKGYMKQTPRQSDTDGKREKKPIADSPKRSLHARRRRSSRSSHERPHVEPGPGAQRARYTAHRARGGNDRQRTGGGDGRVSGSADG